MRYWKQNTQIIGLLYRRNGIESPNKKLHIQGIDFIKAKLTKETLLGIWQPISTIHEEANSQKAESSLTRVGVTFFL